MLSSIQAHPLGGFLILYTHPLWWTPAGRTSAIQPIGHLSVECCVQQCPASSHRAGSQLEPTWEGAWQLCKDGVGDRVLQEASRRLGDAEDIGPSMGSAVMSWHLKPNVSQPPGLLFL